MATKALSGSDPRQRPRLATPVTHSDTRKQRSTSTHAHLSVGSPSPAASYSDVPLRVLMHTSFSAYIWPWRSSTPRSATGASRTLHTVESMSPMAAAAAAVSTVGVHTTTSPGAAA